MAHEINNPVSFIYSNLSHGDVYAREMLEILQLYQQYYRDPVPKIEAIASDIELDFATEDFPRLMDSMNVGAEGARVRISIADNGPGMTDLVQLRLFDPFFTTKLVGKGTGLGLSISYQTVVEQHRGRLSCVSAPGLGAELIVEIPLA